MGGAVCVLAQQCACLPLVVGPLVAQRLHDRAMSGTSGPNLQMQHFYSGLELPGADGL